MEQPSKKTPSADEITTAEEWPIWEKGESVFDWYYTRQETCYVVEGEVSVSWDGGELSFGKGDLVTFPEGLRCMWNVKRKIRKHYTFG